MATWPRLVVSVGCSIIIPQWRNHRVHGGGPSSLLNLLGSCSYLLRRRAIYQLDLHRVLLMRTDWDELFLELCILPPDRASGIPSTLPEWLYRILSF